MLLPYYGVNLGRRKKGKLYIIYSYIERIFMCVRSEEITCVVLLKKEEIKKITPESKRKKTYEYTSPRVETEGFERPLGRPKSWKPAKNI